MNDESEDDFEMIIPAASIGDIDLQSLAMTNPEAASEIARLDGPEKGVRTIY